MSKQGKFIIALNILTVFFLTISCTFNPEVILFLFLICSYTLAASSIFGQMYIVFLEKKLK